MGDGYMCGRNVKMKESLSHFCGISFLPKWDFFFAAYKRINITHFAPNCLKAEFGRKGFQTEQQRMFPSTSMLQVCR